MNDVVINKIQSIQRCVRRAREEYEADPGSFASNYTRQDAALLNVVRACETAIDLANHIIRVHKLGIPVSSADSFELLKAERIISSRLAERMKRMVGFRNTVVHQYTKVDLAIVEAVIVTELDELLAFVDQIRQYVNGSPS
ncbi:MAG TPA: DUF86 domain-containing protein [Terriglobia bacterium]|nr:DUF86 domain-containing protein [Terriglobia bacterium]